MIDYGQLVKLGPLRKSNLEEYRIARNSIGIRQWCRQTDLISEEDQIDWYANQRTNPTIRMYEIMSKENPGLGLGVCGLTDIDQVNQRAEFSLYILADHRNNGFGKAALLTLIQHGFNSLNLNSIWGETFEGNPAWSMFVKVGFNLEGTRKDFYFKKGKFIDCHLYSVQRDTWKTTK